jgi:hypothetical protein
LGDNALVRQTVLLFVKALIWGISINIGLKLVSEPLLPLQNLPIQERQSSSDVKAHNLDTINP